MEKREDVIYVGPNYYWSLGSDDLDSTDYENFGLQNAANIIQLSYAWDELERWQLSTVKVGIIDTGIQGDHPLLEENINESDSRDFANANDATNPTDDISGHGTKVAGIVKGVCPNVELISLRVHNVSNNKIDSSDVYDAINHAIEEDIDILNLSLLWDGDSTSGFDEMNYNIALDTIINAYSGLIVCCAGNKGENIDNNNLDYTIYPQEYTLENLLVVGASNGLDRNSDTKRSDSNYGIESVDLFAPGTNIVTTIIGSGVGEGSQTSMATPLVTGTAALLLSIDNTLTTSELKSIILDSADEIDNLSSYCEDGKRLNVYEAVCKGKEYYDHHSHNVSYYNQTVSAHTTNCSTCTYIISEPHSLTNYVASGIAGHNATCMYCGYSGVFEHTWLNMGNIYRCIDCQYFSTFVPQPGVNSVSNENDNVIASLPPSKQEDEKI